VKKGLLLLLAFVLLASGVIGCKPAPPPPKEVIPPKVELQRIEVAQYWPFFLDTKKRRGSPLNLAFVYTIENPNDFKVMLDTLQFTVSFEPQPGAAGVELNTIVVYEDMYIPANTTNQLRVVGAFDAFTVLLKLLVISGPKLAELGLKPPFVSVIKNWWETVGEFGFNIHITNGWAEFTSEYGPARSTFTASFP